MERKKLYPDASVPKQREPTKQHSPFPWRKDEKGNIVSADGNKLFLTGVSFPIGENNSNGNIREAAGNRNLLYKAQYVDRAIRLLRRIVNDLPSRRDWLDPVIEAEAKALIKDIDERENTDRRAAQVLETETCWCRRGGCDCNRCRNPRKKEDKTICCECHN